MTEAVLTFSFDPVIRLTDTASVRFETLAIAAVLALGLALAAVIGRRTAAPGAHASVEGLPAVGLRPDDLLFIAIGAVPGALLGGRVGYVLDHLDYYRANPGLMTDFSQGALSLTLAVPFGILTAAIIARLIGAPVGRWMHASAVPLLVVLGAGKLAGVLGATGQGSPADLPWATAYVGPGPWGSLAPAVASQPAQVYEAILIALAIGVLFLLARFEVVARLDGGALFAALGLWAIVRFVVAFAWRDPVLAGPFRVDQVLSVLLVAFAGLGLAERSRAPVRLPGWSDTELEAEPAE